MVQAGTSPLLRALGSDSTAPTPNFLFPQSATDIAQIRELQTQVEDVKKEKQSLQEKVIPAGEGNSCPACGTPAEEWELFGLEKAFPGRVLGIHKPRFFLLPG